MLINNNSIRKIQISYIIDHKDELIELFNSYKVKLSNPSEHLSFVELVTLCSIYHDAISISECEFISLKQSVSNEGDFIC